MSRKRCNTTLARVTAIFTKIFQFNFEQAKIDVVLLSQGFQRFSYIMLYLVYIISLPLVRNFFTFFDFFYKTY